MMYLREQMKDGSENIQVVSRSENLVVLPCYNQQENPKIKTSLLISLFILKRLKTFFEVFNQKLYVPSFKNSSLRLKRNNKR